MSPSPYQQVEDLYHAALELPADRRPRFLADACGDDHDLQQEVESLLRAHDAAGDFITASAMDDAARGLAGLEEAGTLTGRVGDYEMLGRLGRGGMGEVYLAHDTRLDRRVAIKLLRPGLTANTGVAQRFAQEARAASSLNHPNIVTIYEIGEVDGRRFLAMELVEGQSVAALLGRPAAATWVARVGAQLAQALSVAHAAGIVHRDIKPENVMLRDDGYVKLLDFGLARLLSAAAGAGTDTAPALILGTPRYMSPEQARGESAGPASDVFSLGVILYELVTGTHPFDAGNALGTMHAISTLETPRPGQRAPAIPGRLDRLLARMLSKHPADRPPAAVVDAELGLIAQGRVDDDGRRALPPQRTPWIGRAEETERVTRMLRDGVRLMTLTGSGGTGKTRLALHIAEQLEGSFEGGVTFVDLAPLADPMLVPSAIASALGLREAGDRPLAFAVAEHLRGMGRTLLLIDNFEQVSAAAALVRELLDNCPALVVLVTSRVVLRIYGEQEFPVPPLPLPGPEAAASVPALLQCASIALFVQRAAAGRPDFRLTESNAPAVVDICRRLDGLPLAIELAAARIKILPPADLRLRIERRLELLTGGPRDLPERQQTLRRTIQWSYDLLTPPEQMLFRRLSVFAGGGTLEAIEAVCNTVEDLGVDVLDGVTALVESSLLVQRVTEGSEPRFTMLDTFREYGRDRLLESGEMAATERAHAAYMLVLAEEATVDMAPHEREIWLRSCEAEHENLRAAIQCLITAGNAEWALRLAGALFRFWEQRDHLTEGQKTLASVLAMPGAGAPTPARARALFGAAVLSDLQVDISMAERFSHEACAIYRQSGDTQAVATVMVAMAWQAQRRGRYAEATALFEETVSLWQQLGDATAVDLARSNMATAAKLGGNFGLARSLLEQVAAAFAARGDARGVASALNGLGDVAAAQGDHDSARRYHAESLGRFRDLDDRWGIAGVLADLANVDVQARDYAAAARSLATALRAFRELGHQRGVARQLESLAVCAAAQLQDGRAVTLASAAASIRTTIGWPPKQHERQRTEETLSLARARLSAAAYAAAWQTGRTATLEQLLDQ